MLAKVIVLADVIFAFDILFNDVIFAGPDTAAASSKLNVKVLAEDHRTPEAL